MCLLVHGICLLRNAHIKEQTNIAQILGQHRAFKKVHSAKFYFIRKNLVCIKAPVLNQ